MGALDNLTILRYGHVYDSGGGMEQYLSDLNGALAARSSLTTLQVQLTSNSDRVGEFEEPVPQGKHLRVSLFVDQASHEQSITSDENGHGLAARLKTAFREYILFAPGIYPLFTRLLLKQRKIPRRAGEPVNVGKTVRGLHRRHPINLICLHSAGGADTAEILAFADEEKIPVTYVHHFSNDRLNGFAMRAQLDRMAGVSGVCGTDIPAYLRHRFVTVADGIDTAFFKKENAQPVDRTFDAPLIFLGARITQTKGQAQVVRAAGELKRRGLAFHVALAGRLDSAAYEKKILDLIHAENVEDRISLIGQLTTAKLRDWYGMASVIAFPTLHHEGLPRILMECQAMGVPPVVHRIGGTPDGVVDSETGYLVAPDDFATFVNRLETLLKQPDLRARFATAGRQLVETKFSIQALASRHEGFYLATLKTTHAAHR
jgi:glycosyltransferase involved in cell wall biosynthesis